MRHGTNVGYVIHLCRCDDCRRANREYEKARVRRLAQGRSLFVPAEPVRQRWLELRALGMSDDEIERVAGIDDKVSDALFRKHWRTGKPIQRMKRENAEAIMAVRHRAPNPRTYVVYREFREMALDLMALGYSGRWVSEQVGLSYQGRARLLTARHTAKACAAMKRLHGSTITPAPDSPEASRSRNFAARNRRSDGVWRAA